MKRVAFCHRTPDMPGLPGLVSPVRGDPLRTSCWRRIFREGFLEEIFELPKDVLAAQ